MGDAYSDNLEEMSDHAFALHFRDREHCHKCSHHRDKHRVNMSGQILCPGSFEETPKWIPRRFRRREGSPYVLQPGAVYQIPGTKVGVKNVTNTKVVLAPVEFDKLRV